MSLKTVEALLRWAYLPELKAMLDEPLPDPNDKDAVLQYQMMGLFMVATQESRIRERVRRSTEAQE